LRDKVTEKPESRVDSRVFNWIAILLIAATAILLRVYALDRLPPGLFGDEAVEGLDALDVLAGNFAIWFHAHLGREPLFVYLVALSYRAFGITPLATRLPAIVAGLITLPATFLLAREWGRNAFDATGQSQRVIRITFLTTALLAISFWHIQMTRDAHRDTLLPLVEALGYWLLWRALRTHDWKTYVASGAVLGLAIYTYSPGRFVGIFVALFIVVELVIQRLTESQPPSVAVNRWPKYGLVAAAFAAFVVMLPLGLYFAQNPVQFSRRFESVSVFDADSPPVALATSVAGNLAQFVVPGAGYQSKHYNLPGKPVFDLLIAPWFLVGLAIAIARRRQSAYRFLLLWFAVMMMPAFLTVDMIPKGVRALGVVPGVFVFPALAMEEALDWAQKGKRFWGRGVAAVLIGVSLAASAGWTAFDFFGNWANMPELSLAFDADMVEVSQFIQQQSQDHAIYISSEVYRPPTEMLLGRHVPTSRYTDRATRIREFDARTTLVSGANDNLAAYVFVREQAPPAEWLARLTPQTIAIGEGTYLSAVRIEGIVPPEHVVDLTFNPLLKLVGYTRFSDEPRGIVLYWQVAQIPEDRQDLEATISYADPRGNVVTQDKRIFGYPPLEWASGDSIVEWYARDIPETATQFTIQLVRGSSRWESPPISLR
jgi:4-amino-4-deoxy-L-arabinose transferase-like glycosyltransferase